MGGRNSGHPVGEGDDSLGDGPPLGLVAVELPFGDRPAEGVFVLVVGPYDPVRDKTTLASRPLLATLPAGSTLLITVSNLNLATLPPNALQPES